MRGRRGDLHSTRLDRRRLEIPLSGGAGRSKMAHHRRLAIGQDSGEAGLTTLREG